MGCKNLDVQGETPVRNDPGELFLDDRASKLPGKTLYERLSDVKFDWELDSLTEVHPLGLVIKAIKADEMEQGCWYNIAEILKAPGVEGAQQIGDIIEDIIHSGKIPTRLNWMAGKDHRLPLQGQGHLSEEIIEASNC